jgi:hypothetical protein
MIKQRAKGKGQRLRKIANSYQLSAISSQKGIALAMILILSAIALAIMAGLIYMILTGTRISGMQKRYESAREAAKGGADVTYQLIGARGNPNIPGISFYQTTSDACLTDKLNKNTSLWSNCYQPDPTIMYSTIDPSNTASYDFRFDLGASPYPTYRVYARIIYTVEGNSGADEGLIGKGVVASGSGEVTVVSKPYLYSIELDSENQSNPAERSKWSVLYQY